MKKYMSIIQKSNNPFRNNLYTKDIYKKINGNIVHNTK